MVTMPIPRCATGIIGFDAVCQGGFVSNSTNVLLGGPGSGKTTFLFQFLWNGATQYNENGLYCSFEPDVVETLKDAMAFGWDFSKLNEEDRVKFLKFSPHTTIDELKAELTRLVSRYNIKRVCFDPISVLAMNVNDPAKVREMVFELASLMKRLNVTSILADEAMDGCDIHSEELDGKTDVIKFLTDSVTTLHESGMSGVGDRAIRIMKMRRTNHIRGPVGMSITDHGLDIFPDQVT